MQSKLLEIMSINSSFLFIAVIIPVVCKNERSNFPILSIIVKEFSIYRLLNLRV